MVRLGVSKTSDIGSIPVIPAKRLIIFGRVVELVGTQDLKSCGQ